MGAGVAVLCCLPVLAAAIPASVPALTAAQLRNRILASQHKPFDGYAESNADFNLPPFPAFSSVTPLLDGITRMRVWQQDPGHWRVDTLSDAGESDTYQAGGDEYVWSSGAELLTGIYGKQTVRLPRGADLVPSALAVRIIDDAGPHAGLRLLPPRRVAGQSVAGLAITPASAASTIGQADIWASPGTGLPMLVEVFGKGTAMPALTSQFLQAGAWKPDSAILTPRHGPGSGFTATTPGNFAGVLQNLGDAPLPALLDGFARQPSPVGYGQVGVYGGGLAPFAVFPFGPGTGGQLLADAVDAGATRLPVRNGTGAMASAPLVNLVLVRPCRSPDTFLLIGLVSKSVLVRAAQELALRS
ncbi:MAG TPA: hypothetical protein VG164_11680 [Trebonia sp.]|jgi:hypothetical protein|nr:hypothetical protein [Trebonia sp.]